MKCLRCGKAVEQCKCQSCGFDICSQKFSGIYKMNSKSMNAINSLIRSSQASKYDNKSVEYGSTAGSSVTVSSKKTSETPDKSGHNNSVPTTPQRRKKGRLFWSSLIIAMCAIIAFIVVKHMDRQSSSDNGLIVIPANAAIGDTVAFGHYEQDADLSNGKEPISWFIADISDGKALLVSEKCLDCMSYSAANSDSWTDSDVRKWLNDDFYSNSFSTEEQACISESTVISGYPVLPSDYMHEENTNDKIFVLDFDEYREYVTGDAKLSAYARKEYLAAISNSDCNTYESSEEEYCSNETEYGENYSWCLLRNLGPIENTVQFVHWFDEVGIAAVGNGFCDASSYVAIRPAMWVYADSDGAGNEDNSTQSESSAEELSGEDTTRFYNWELLHRDDENWNHRFGNNKYATYESNASVHTEEELFDYFHEEFCERLEVDPAFAASVMAYVDKYLHTRYAGQFGSEFSDASESEWLEYINETKTTFISDPNLQIEESNALAKLLSNCQISIIEMNCPVKHMTMFLGEDDIPQISIETLEDHKFDDDNAYKNFHAFTYEVNIKGTVIPLYFCMDCGFAPILY